VKHDMSINQKIWQLPSGSRLTKEEWSQIITHLVDMLRDYLQQPVEVPDSLIGESIIDDEAICCPIRSPVPFGGPLAVAWEGTLGLEVIDGRPYISASLFLFSNGNRLVVAGQLGSYLELVYEKAESGVSNWHSLGWIEDIYGEFEAIDEYTGGDEVPFVQEE
jgi:hypothetical protein